MAANLNLPPRDQTDYIDIKNTSNSAEFEFKMSSVTSQTDVVISTADELFFRGTLLPLHLPLRLQMFEKLLPNSLSDTTTNAFDAFTTARLTAASHDYFFDCVDKSCNVSPEFDADEYVSYDSSDETVFINVQLRKLSSKMFKFIKESSIRSKVNASRAYIKSLFSKTSCCSTVDCIKINDSSFCSKRGNLNKSCELKFGEGSGKFDSEIESSIQSAIAHCKRSYQKSVSEIGFCSLSGSRVAFEDHER